jgi:transcriptional regulator with XRE-family HTH domain
MMGASDYRQDWVRRPGLHEAVAFTLRLLRVCRGWSQGALARELAAGRSWVTRLEAGELMPNISTVHKIAAAYDLPTSGVIAMAEALASQGGLERARATES